MIEVKYKTRGYRDNHPLTDINIRQGLEQVLDEFKEEMKSMNPNMSIRRQLVELKI